MAVDPEISLGLKPPQTILSGNPLETISQFQAIQNAQNQLKQFGATFAARQKAGQIIAASPDLNTGLNAALADPDVAAFAPDVIQTAREAQLAQARVQGETQQQALAGIEQFYKGLPGLLENPQAFGQQAQAALALTSPNARASVDSAIRNTYSALTEGLPDDPQQRAAELTKRLVGTSLGAGGIPVGQIQGIIGTPTTQNVGSAILPGVTAPAQGAPLMAGGAAPGSFTPTGQLSLGLSPQVVTVPTPTGAPESRIVGGGYGTGGASPNALGALAPGAQVTLPGSNPNLLPAVPPELQRQLGMTAGGGNVLGVGPSNVNANYQAARGKAGAEYQGNLDNAVTAGYNTLQNLGVALPLLDQIKAGGGAATYTRMGEIAQGLGAPQDMVDAISNGKPGKDGLSASQEFQKIMVNTTSQQIQQQLSGNVHLGQAAFDTFNKNNPNIETDPRAIEKIFNFWKNVYSQNVEQQKELNDHLRSGGDISEWPAIWQQRAQKLGYINPNPTNVTGQGTNTPQANVPASTPPTAAPTLRYIPGKGLVPIGAQ